MVHDTAVAKILQTALLVPMVALWAFHLYQRRYKEASVRKRVATLSLTMIVIAAWVAAWVFNRYGVDDRFLLALPVAAVLIVISQRRLMWPFRARCARCGNPLALERILSFDSNTCAACAPAPKEGDPS
jgi:hypothetical protein